MDVGCSVLPRFLMSQRNLKTWLFTHNLSFSMWEMKPSSFEMQGGRNSHGHRPDGAVRGRPAPCAPQGQLGLCEQARTGPGAAGLEGRHPLGRNRSRLGHRVGHDRLRVCGREGKGKAAWRVTVKSPLIDGTAAGACVHRTRPSTPYQPAGQEPRCPWAPSLGPGPGPC